MLKLLMFGDAQLYLGARVMLLEKPGCNPVVCDFSECGMYIAGKHARDGFTVQHTTLEQALSKYAHYELVAWNNYIARQLHTWNLINKPAAQLLQKLKEDKP